MSLATGLAAHALRKIGRGLIASIAVTGTVLVGVAGLSNPAQAAPAVKGGGYVWANNPTTASYTPSTTYQWNSTSPWTAVNTIERMDVGYYAVRFPGLGVTGGTAHVTAYGGGTERCKVQSWGPAGVDQRVYVRCHNRGGAPTDTMFTASFTNMTTAGAGRLFGYLWANQPASASYTPSGTYQANSSGATNTVTRSAVGVYSVRLPGLGVARGDVQVTAYGAGSERCKVTGWGPNAGAQVVGVRCFDNAGAPVDSTYTLTYVDKTNILGMGVCCSPDGNPTAYAWANQPAAASYTPATDYQFAGFAGNNGTITRSGVGVYNVKWPYIGLANGNVQVTAYGAGGEYCKVGSWNDSSGIQVRCFNTAAGPVDTMFDVAFTGPFVIG